MLSLWVANGSQPGLPRFPWLRHQADNAQWRTATRHRRQTISIVCQSFCPSNKENVPPQKSTNLAYKGKGSKVSNTSLNFNPFSILSGVLFETAGRPSSRQSPHLTSPRMTNGIATALLSETHSSYPAPSACIHQPCDSLAFLLKLITSRFLRQVNGFLSPPFCRVGKSITQ